jgi:hypothetical protein
MKLCKDCKHYRPPVSGHGGSLLPGFAWYFPAKCGHTLTPLRIDPVTGDKLGGATEDCRNMRADESRCGLCGHWFYPVNLDGRLAMLEVEK